MKSILPSFWKHFVKQKKQGSLRRTCFFPPFRSAEASGSRLPFRQPPDYSSRFPDSRSFPNFGRFFFFVASLRRRRLLSLARHFDIQSESLQWCSHAPLRHFHLHPTYQTPGHGKYTPSAKTKKAGVVATRLLSSLLRLCLLRSYMSP